MAVSDIEKLRPELLQKSPAELARLAAEIDMARAELARREAVRAKEELATQANGHIEAVIAGVKFLHENGVLPEKITAAFSRGDGTFNPGTFLRQVTPESLVPRTAGAPRRRRRTKAEMEAARSAK